MAEMSSDAPGVGAFKHLVFLIAEDSRATADVLTYLIEREGGRCVGPFARCSEAIVALDTSPVDIALVDMDLRDGFADPLIEELVTRDIPYAIVTGYRSLPTNAMSDAIGILAKPITAAALAELIKPFSEQVEQS